MTQPILPNEIWLMILERLDSIKALMTCKLVNKNWNQIINDQIKIRDLACLNPIFKYGPPKIRYFHFTNDPIDKCMSLNHDETSREFVAIFQRFNNLLLISRIRSLFIYGLHWHKYRDFFDFDKNSNLFGTLKKLEIEDLYVDYESLSHTFQINLPQLEILSYGGAYSEDICLKIICSKLVKFHCGSRNNHIEMTNAHQITHLSISALAMYEFDLTIFTGVQFLYLDFEGPSYLINLFELEKLKEIHVSKSHHKREVLSELIEARAKLNKQHVKIYFSSLRFDSMADLELDYMMVYKSYNFYWPITNRHIIHHSDRLSHTVQTRTEIDYGELIRHLPVIPADFHSRFIRIERILVGFRLGSESDLIDFIRQLKILKSLTIRCSSLSRNFYRNLHEFLSPYVRELDIDDSIEEGDLNLKNFNMFYLSVNCPLSYDDIEHLIKEDNLIQFVIDGKRIVVEDGVIKVGRKETILQTVQEVKSSLRTILASFGRG